MQGEGLSTDELFAQAFAQLRQLKNRMVTRRGRDKALELTTGLFLSINDISRHVGAASFTERPVAVEDDEDSTLDERVSMAELMNAGGGDDVEDLPDAEDVDELRRQIELLKKSRLQHFQSFLDYFVKGCRQEQEVTRKVLACVRRVRPQVLEQFGLSQADVARKLGEVRATVSAREKRVVEKTLKKGGARGVLANGARGAATSAACAKAARGNTHRKTAAAKKRPLQTFTIPEDKTKRTA